MPRKYTATPQDTLDHMLGSGAIETYSWFRRVDERVPADNPDAWEATVTIEDGNGGTVAKVINHAVIMETARKIVREHLHCYPDCDISRIVRESANLIFEPDSADFDAPLASSFLEILILGKVVYC